MRRLVLWSLLALVSVVSTLLIFFPAAWLAAALEAQTGGRLTMGDPQGSLWQGSAFIGAAAGPRDPVTPLLPGRFSWQLSPMILLGDLDLLLENNESLSQALHVTGSWNNWQVGPSAIVLPAERLAGLGAPLNTIVPSGQMRLSWGGLQLARQGAKVDVFGQMTLDMLDIASRMSAIKPLGSYQLIMDWSGQQAQLTMRSVKGPLLLSGNGALANGRFQFSGKAEAATGQEETLANLLNLLGQRRKEGDKDVIALEFKS
ncbi:MAG: type II secretion system protein N [Pseudomonadota bacterium]